MRPASLWGFYDTRRKPSPVRTLDEIGVEAIEAEMGARVVLRPLPARGCSLAIPKNLRRAMRRSNRRGSDMETQKVKTSNPMNGAVAAATPTMCSNGCKRVAWARGLCGPCYQKMRTEKKAAGTWDPNPVRSAAMTKVRKLEPMPVAEEIRGVPMESEPIPFLDRIPAGIWYGMVFFAGFAVGLLVR